MSNAKSTRPGKGPAEKADAGVSPKEVKVTMAFPVATFQKTFYFNRFRLESLDTYVLMTFALARTSGEILCCFRCLSNKSEISDTKESLTSFMAKQLDEVEPALHHHFEPPSANPNTVDIPIINQINIGIQMERNSAELVLSRYSILTVANVSRMESSTKPAIPVEGVALLRCEPSLFKLFLVKLYEAAERTDP